MYCWDHFLKALPFSDMAIVAHSAGGYATVRLLHTRAAEVLPRLRTIALTDSAHSPPEHAALRHWFRTHVVDWVASGRPLDAEVRDPWAGCPCRSAGHPKHEYTSGVAFPAVFAHVEAALEEGDEASEMTSTLASHEDESTQDR